MPRTGWDTESATTLKEFSRLVRLCRAWDTLTGFSCSEVSTQPPPGIPRLYVWPCPNIFAVRNLYIFYHKFNKSIIPSGLLSMIQYSNKSSLIHHSFQNFESQNPQSGPHDVEPFHWDLPQGGWFLDLFSMKTMLTPEPSRYQKSRKGITKTRGISLKKTSVSSKNYVFIPQPIS